MGFEIKLEPRDAWVGLFWDVKPRSAWATTEAPKTHELHLYICPVPFVVLHLWREHEPVDYYSTAG